MTTDPIDMHPSTLRLRRRAESSRKTRCRTLRRITLDRCPNEALDEYGLCLRHLMEAARYWQDLISEACDTWPGLRALQESEGGLCCRLVAGQPPGPLPSVVPGVVVAPALPVVAMRGSVAGCDP
jgi:hypothetical protein